MNILTIGGSDPSTGAGIQGDIRVLFGLGAHPLSVITAVTSQNTSFYSGTSRLSVSTIREQLYSITSDFEISAVKVGMLYSADIIKSVATILEKITAPIIVDPVMISTTRGVLMLPTALDTFCSKILPLCDVVTPNLFEAQKLSAKKKESDCARIILAKGAKSVIITGIEHNKSICDYVFTPKKTIIKTSTRKFETNHGGGCAHSAAITFAMAQGKNIVHAARFARKFVETHIPQSIHVGKGIAITGTRDATDINKLGMAITSFCSVPFAYTLIPECQSNFVLAPKDVVSVGDILGICGRITKAGTCLVVAGTITRGGSTHVASALFSMRTKFPVMTSCINIRRSTKILATIKKLRLSVATFERDKEPRARKAQENTTMIWGIKSAISTLSSAPDIVHNAGSFGKEPMILIFGRDTNDVLNKVRKIITAMHNFT